MWSSTLKIAQTTGLQEDAHFYISFKTQFSGVEIDESLKEINPDEMTIVLQHQFWDLIVSEELLVLHSPFPVLNRA